MNKLPTDAGAGDLGAPPDDTQGNDPVVQALDDAAAAIQKAKDAYSGEEKTEPEAPPAPGGMPKEGAGNMLKGLGIGG